MRSVVVIAVSLVATFASGGGASAHRADLRTGAEPYGHVATGTRPSYYRPCPADVLLADGRHACLGCPAGCGFDR